MNGTAILITALDVLTILTIVAGLFFMFIGALGIWRLPDLFNRMHAASKCVTLGITGLLIAVVLHLWSAEIGVGTAPDVNAEQVESVPTQADVLGAVTKALLVIVFQFVAAPVGAHMLARAAHCDGIEIWDKTLSDELKEDAIHEKA